MTWGHQQATALSSAIKALNQSGIPWLVLRNWEGLPKNNRSKDVDLGLERRNLAHAEQIIANTFLQHGFDRVLTQDFQYVRCLTFFSIHEANTTSIKVDLLDGFVWRGAQLVAFEKLYAFRVPYLDFFVPSVTDDAVMLWMKPLLTGGVIKERYVCDIKRAIASDPEQFLARLTCTFGPGIAKEVWPLIAQGALSDTLQYKNRLAYIAWLRAARKNPVQTVTASVKHISSEVTRRSRRRPASLLAVVGPDGVGKTTFINLLKQEVARLSIKDLSDVQVKHFRPHILPNIKQLLSGSRHNKSTEDFGKPHRAAPASPASSLARIVYYWVDYLLGYWLIIRRLCARGTVVIFDRYFYDFIVDPKRSRINLPAWIRERL